MPYGFILLIKEFKIVRKEIITFIFKISEVIIMATRARIWKPDGKSVDAREVYSKIPFFCDIDHCDAPMLIVSMGENSAYFRSKSQLDHKFPICIRNDIKFHSDKYDKDLFKLNSFKNRMLSVSEKTNIHKGSGRGGTVGTGSRIAPDTLKTIYAAYVESISSGEDTIGDCKYSDFMRCKENYKDFIADPSGFFIVETSYYHKVKDEFALLLNVPIFDPKTPTYHVKVNFTNTNDFWSVYNHYKKLKKPYLDIMLVAAEWGVAAKDSEYIAECTVTKSSQHTYITPAK